MAFGCATVLDEFGLIMTVGILIGTYPSIWVAPPAFRYLRGRFGPREGRPARTKKTSKPTAVV